MATFFISYSRNDGAEAANQIRNHISKLDSSHDVFLDIHSIRAGSNWKAELKRKIIAADYFIYIHSPKGFLSSNVKEELKWVKESELKSGIRKLFVYRIGYAELTADISPYQISDATENFAIDFYKLMTGIFSEHSFYNIEYDIEVVDEYWYKGKVWIEAPAKFLTKIQMVEYRFDYGWDEDALCIVKGNEINCRKKFEKKFDTKYHFTLFVMIYLWNTRELAFVKKIQISH